MRLAAPIRAFLASRNESTNPLVGLMRAIGWPAITVVAFGLFYGAAWSTGMRFTTWYVDDGWQMLPREPLVSDPLRSLWYLHIQPPVWNGVVGFTMRLSPLPDALSLQLLMAGLALTTVWLAADLLWRVTSNPLLSVGAPLFAILNPVAFANILEPRYELAVTMLVMLCAWLPVRLSTRPFRAFVLVTWTGTALVMTRALYHPVWLAIVVTAAGLMLMRHRSSARRMVVALAPISLVVFWMLKNLVLFGTFSLSSWTGMNALRSIEPMIDQQTLSTMWESDEISAVGFVGPFASLDEYEQFGLECDRSHHHPVLDVRLREGRLTPVSNFNNECYLALYRQAGRDALELIRERPGAWLRGRWEGSLAYASQPDDASIDASPVLRLTRSVYRVVDLQVPGRIPVRLLSQGNEAVSVRTNYAIVATASTLASVALAGALLRRGVRERLSARPGLAVAILVVGVTTAWTAVVGICTELGEQARFRSAVQVCTIVVCVAGVACLRRHRDECQAPGAYTRSGESERTPGGGGE